MKGPAKGKISNSGFGHLRCSALENSGSKSPQTRIKPKKSGRHLFCRPFNERRRQNRYRPNRERRGKKKRLGLGRELRPGSAW